MAGRILKTIKITSAAALTLNVGQSLVSVTLTGGAAGSSLVIEGYDEAGAAVDRVTIAALTGDMRQLDWAEWALTFDTAKLATAPPEYLKATVVGAGIATLYTL